MKPLLYYGVAVIFLVAEGSEKPTCEENLIKDKKATSCNNLGLTTVPLTIIDKDTVILLLSYNSMKSISTSVFQSLPQLVELDLSNNGMSAINIDYSLKVEELNLANNSFDHLPELSLLKNLGKIDLSNNDIASVPDTAFHGLSGLKELYLQRNKITKLSDQAFKGLKLLDTLNLSFNRLTSVPPKLISDSVKLAKFNLRGNSLSHIPRGFFYGLDIGYVYLDLNPWKCTCSLAYLKEWMGKNEFNIYTISDGSPENEITSVVCTNNVPLVDFKLSCSRKGDEDPATPELQAGVYNAILTTTTETMTTSQPTTPAMTTTTKTTSQPTTPAMTTTTKTTSQPTTPARTTTTKTTSQPTTSEVTTKVQTTSHPTTPVMTPAMKTSQSTKLVMTTQLSLPIPQTTTLVISATEIENTTTSHPESQQATTFGRETETPRQTMAHSPELFPSMSKRRSWLEETIVKHCCFLHLLVYSIILLLLLLQMVVCLVVVTWACTSHRHYSQILRERVPRVRLIRYSWRTLQDKDDFLLVHGGNSHFGRDDPIPMLVLEPGSRDYSRSYTPAILT